MISIYMYGTNGSKNLLKKMYYVLSVNVIKGAIVSVFSKSFILSMYCFYNYKKNLKNFLNWSVNMPNCILKNILKI